MKIIISVLILTVLLSINVLAQDFESLKLEGHTGSVSKLVFSADGTTLASTSDDRTIRIWNVLTGTQIHSLTGHDSNVNTAAFSPNGDTIASGDSGGKIRLWDVSTGQYRVTLEGHRNSVTSVAFSPDGKTLASGSSDRTIRLWNATTGLYKVTLEGHTDYISSIAFSPDGKTLASGSYDRTIRLWDATTGFHQKTLTGHSKRVYWISFIENGETIASNGENQKIHLWNSSTGQSKDILSVNNFRNVAISLDKRMLAGADWDHRISMWDIATNSEVASLVGHTSDIYSVTFSPDGKNLASGGSDRIIRLWDISTHINITPSTVESPPVGEEFDIDINIVNGEDVRGYKLTLEYDSNFLSYVSHEYSDYFSEDDTYEGPIEDMIGSVSFSVVSTADAGDGDGTLATITFEVVSRGASTFGLTAILSDSDGNRLPYIVISGNVVEPPWDVNGDGSVDILDLSFVAARFGKENQTQADVNGDGDVDIKDLIIVASGMKPSAAAPSTGSLYSETNPSKEEVQNWLNQSQYLDQSNPTMQKGIHFLQVLLSTLTPKETALFPNYPNPFNPETWIPYQLSKPSDVILTINAVDGSVVRIFEIGHKAAGMYQDKTRALYWNGKNEVGESVASGLYFYTLTAGNYTTTRKMLILK